MITTKKSIRKIAFGVLVAGLAVGFSAFTNNYLPSFTTVYSYPGSNDSNWNQPGAWNPSEPTGNCGPGEIPCRIDLSKTDKSDLASFLNSFNGDYSLFMIHDAVSLKE